MSEIQACGRCGELKPLLSFSPSRRGKNGYPCKECVKIESANRRLDYGKEDAYRCGNCELVLSASEFSPSKRTNGAYCKNCCAKVAKRSRDDSFDANLNRRLARYGLTRDEYYEMLFDQEGKCAICFEFLFDELHIDHDEETGVKRGLLCGNCNRGIGCLGHDIERLQSAITYLSKTARNGDHVDAHI